MPRKPGRKSGGRSGKPCARGAAGTRKGAAEPAAGDAPEGGAGGARLGAAEEIRNRVRELRMVRAGDFKKNPNNYREHPLHQRELIRGLFAEIGFVDVWIARETPEGLELIDGHMRTEEVPDEQLVPCLIVDLEDHEVDKVLATLDPITSLASQNDEMLRDLLDRIETQNADIRRFLADQEHELEKVEVPEVTEEEKGREVSGMDLEAHEHYDYLVVLCTTTQEWNVLVDRLGLPKVKMRRGSMGVSRAIRAAKLLEALNS